MKSGGQNRSSAVMQQRAEPNDSLDDFPTPPWATRALIEHALPKNIVAGRKAWEPCCNRGYMAMPLAEYASDVYCTDVHDYGWGGIDKIEDFLFPGAEPPEPVDFVIANPPFLLAEQFIAKALDAARIGSAFFVRTSFLEGEARYKNLYSVRPPTIVAHFAERVILTKGILRDPNKKYFDPEARDPKTGLLGVWKWPSTATSYTWLIWLPMMERQPVSWIPPCRRELERFGDYPE